MVYLCFTMLQKMLKKLKCYNNKKKWFLLLNSVNLLSCYIYKFFSYMKICLNFIYSVKVKILLNKMQYIVKCNTISPPNCHNFVLLPLQSTTDLFTITLNGITYVIDLYNFNNAFINNIMKWGSDNIILITKIIAESTNYINKIPLGRVEDILVFSNTSIEYITNENSTITEINRLLDQLEQVIQRFESFVSSHDFNVVMENGNIGVDTNESVSDSEAQNWANRISILDNLIHTLYHNIENNLEIIKHMDEYSTLLEKLNTVSNEYKHWT